MGNTNQPSLECKLKEAVYNDAPGESLYNEQHIGEGGGVITLKAADVSLHIPEGAVTEETLISIKVKSEPDDRRNGFKRVESVTPIVTCEPRGLTFHKPVEIILPHCALFDDVNLHTATVHIERGGRNFAKGGESITAAVCKLKERYCSIYTRHFSDFEVFISNTKKKRIGVMVFTSKYPDEDSDIRVWYIRDLPSEYIILRRLEENEHFTPFDINGKFILEKENYITKVTASKLYNETFTWDILLNKRRHCFKINDSENATSVPDNIILSVSRVTRIKPLCRLSKQDERKIGFPLSIKEVSRWCEELSQLLLTWSIKLSTEKCFDEASISLLKELSSEIEKNRTKKNIGVIGGSSTSIVGGIMVIVGAALIPVTFGASIGLLATGIAVGLEGSGISIGFSVDKTVSDRLNTLQETQHLCMESDVCDIVKRFITEHEAGRTIDIMNMPDVLGKIMNQSKELVQCLQKVGEFIGKDLLEIKENARTAIINYEDAIKEYNVTDEEDWTFVELAKDYLQLQEIPPSEVVTHSVVAAKESRSVVAAKEGVNTALRVGSITTRKAVDVGDDLVVAGGNVMNSKRLYRCWHCSRSGRIFL